MKLSNFDFLKPLHVSFCFVFSSIFHTILDLEGSMSIPQEQKLMDRSLQTSSTRQRPKGGFSSHRENADVAEAT